MGSSIERALGDSMDRIEAFDDAF